MNRSRKTLFLSLLFFPMLLTSAYGSSPTLTETKPESLIDLGLSLEVLIPNLLPDFDQLVTTWGPIASIAVGDDRLELHATYGSAESISLFLAELNYRYQINFPFLKPYVLGGLGYLKYGANNNDHDFLTPVAGLGIKFGMARDFYVSVGSKIYLPIKTIVCFGGQFTYAL